MNTTTSAHSLMASVDNKLLCEEHIKQKKKKLTAKNYEELGIKCMNDRKYKDAIVYLVQAIQKGRDILLVRLGSCYYYLKEIDTAMEFWEEAGKKGHYIGYSNIAIQYYSRKEYPDAVKYWQLALEAGMPRSKFPKLKSKLINWYISQQTACTVESGCSTKLEQFKDKILNHSKCDDCPVCLENSVKSVKYSCGHYNCGWCHIQIMTTTKKCPMCRSKQK